MALPNPKSSWDVSVFRAYFFLHLCIFQILQLQGPSWLSFMLYQEECVSQALLWVQKQSDQWILWISKTVIGRSPISAETALNSSSLPFVLLPPSQDTQAPLEVWLWNIPSTFICLRLCSNTSTSQKVFWWVLLSLFHYRRKLRQVLFCFASSRDFVVVENGWGLSFCWTTKKPILLLYWCKDLGRGGGGMRWPVDFFHQ